MVGMRFVPYNTVDKMVTCETQWWLIMTEEKEEVQSPGSSSYLWDVFLYLRLPEKQTNMRIVRRQPKLHSLFCTELQIIKY